MNEIEVVKSRIERSVDSLQTAILRYYDTLHELKRFTLFLYNETTADREAIERWFCEDGFGICPDGFWQSLPRLEQYRNKTLARDAVSYSCHPGLRHDRKASLGMYCHRNMGKFLSEIKTRLPTVVWLYYQDAANFALQYPYIDQATAITPDFDWRTYHTWVSVAPENNPERAIQWTAPTVDYAGEGVIISVSIPVYDGEVFLGLWSMDLPLKTLYQEYMEETHIPEQINFITDRNGRIIAHPLIETKIDKEKGSIFQEKIGSLGRAFEKLDIARLYKVGEGHRSLLLADHRQYTAFFKTIPEINWLFFSLFPNDRLNDVINLKIKNALDKVRNGDFSYRLVDIPADVAGSILVKSYNEMAEALEAQHAQIQESQKRIIQAEKLSAIGTLAGGIAHDFNNILTSILGYTELALYDLEKENPMAEYLQAVYTAGIRAKELVRQILTFARQEEEEIRPVRLDGIVREALKLLRSSIPSTIDIKSRILSRSFVMGDTVNLHQILMNLCTNAAHAMENNGVLEVTLEDVKHHTVEGKNDTESHNGPWVKLTVSDTGAGIEPEIMDLIFEPYFTTKPMGGGTGMGLSMVHGIIKKYRGDLTVASKVGRGTVFAVFLPVTHDRGVSDGHAAQPLPIGNERILFIDDEPPVVNVGKQLLTQLGYDVTGCTDSLQALALLKDGEEGFDLVITDMTMPSMTGKELAGKILKNRPGTPIILCTGYSETVSETVAEELGIKAFAYKPIMKSDLAVMVRKVLDETRHTR